MAAGVMALLAIALWPVFAHPILSIGDLENHVVRGWVLLHLVDMPGLSTYFAPNWTIVPNLAIDGLVVLAGPFLSLEAIARLFVALTFVLLLGGCVLLHRAVARRWSVWPLTGVVLLYNRLLFYGLVNYLFGCGLFLIALAGWIGLRERAVWQRVGVLAVLALATCFAHFFAFALLGLTVGLYELACLTRRGVRIRDTAAHLGVACLGFLPSLVVLVVFRPRSGAVTALAYHSLFDRLTAFAVPVIYSPLVTLVGAGVLGLAVLALLLRARLRVDRALMMVCAALVPVQMAMPDRILTAEGADHRIPIALLFLLIAASDFAMPSRRLAIGFMAALLGVTMMRVGQVERHWRQDDAVYAEVLAGLDALPAASRVATAYPPDTAAHVAEAAIAMYYLPVWSVIPRLGFTQTLYTIPTQHPLVLQPAWRALADATQPGALWTALTVTSRTVAQCATLTALQQYDFVILLAQAQPPSVRGSFLVEQAVGQTMRIYKIHKDVPACS